MARKVAQTSPPVSLFTELSYPGPRPIACGDLSAAGVPGVVHAPRSGAGLPAVVFGHGLMQPPARYTGLLRHLATWGIVTACPGTQLGPLPAHEALAADLRTVLETLIATPLGGASVDAAALGVAGHSAGAGAAVLAAAADERIRAVATLAVSESRPSAVQAAAACRIPALHLAGEEDRIAPTRGHAEPIAAAWAGPSQLRSLAKAAHLGFTEGSHWSEWLLASKSQYQPLRTAKVLLTAFFLRHLTGEHRYDELLASDVKGAVITDDRQAPAPAGSLAGR
jgi:pimeloyl-ACP methyl ester carboxylesterase